MTLKFRLIIAILFLSLFIVVAGYSAIPEDNPARSPDSENNEAASWFVEFFNELDEIEIAHVVLHLFAFVTVGTLVGLWGTPPERGSVRLAYTVTIVATVIWEAVQAGVFVGLGGLDGDPFFNAPWVSRVVSDAVVNLIATTLGLLITYLIPQPIEYFANLVWKLNPANKRAVD